MVLAILAIVSTATFADLGIGAVAFSKSSTLPGEQIDLGNLNVNQFGFGGDLRCELGWFQAEGLVFHSSGDVNCLNAYLDAGLALDVALLRLSLGTGPIPPTPSVRAPRCRSV